MSFDKNYPRRKDRRKPYIRRGAADRSCRPHGGCPWCLENRMHGYKKRIESAEGTREGL
jgi:hypothetical protein